jgi:hypothetical protein
MYFQVHHAQADAHDELGAIGYAIISALTFFFKQYGFSRMVVLISAITLLPSLVRVLWLTFRSAIPHGV